MCGFVLFFVNFVTYADLYKPLVQALPKRLCIVHRFWINSIKKMLPQDSGRLAYCHSHILRQRFALISNYIDYLCIFVSSFISSFR